MKNKINIGVLGCAAIAKKSVIPALKELSDLYNIVGIASRSEDKANEFAKSFDTVPFYSYQSLIDDLNIDAVYIPLPNSLHYEWINKSLDRGLHVLVEKSMTCDVKQTKQVNQKAKEKKLVLIENFQFRFHSQFSEILNIVNSGKIGEVRILRSSFGFPPFLDSENIRYKKELGGGALLDAGAYPLKLSQLFFGNKLEVKAANLVYDENKGVDISGSVYLSDNKGGVAQIAFGFDNFYQCNIELWGSKGKLYSNRIFTAPVAFEPEVIIETNDGVEIIKLKSDNHFNKMLKHFIEMIKNPIFADLEYENNIIQSKLINQVRIKANE